VGETPCRVTRPPEGGLYVLKAGLKTRLYDERVARRAGGAGRGIPTAAAAFVVAGPLIRVIDLLAARTWGRTRRQDPRAPNVQRRTQVSETPCRVTRPPEGGLYVLKARPPEGSLYVLKAGLKTRLYDERVARRAGGAGRGIPTAAAAFVVTSPLTRVIRLLAANAGPPSRGLCAMGWRCGEGPGDRTREPQR